jgi:uncharacterized protein (DUF2249 family)
MAASLQQFKDAPIGARQSARMHRPIELDVRGLPLWQRLPPILQAFNHLAPGEAFELVVDLDPWPLRAYLEASRAGQFDWQPLVSGPPVWRVRLRRTS